MDLQKNTWLKLEDEVYHAMDLISFHGLMHCMKSFNHLVAAKAEKKDTPAMRFGRLAHMMALEPARFDDVAKVIPKCDRRTKEGKQAYEEFTASLTPGSIAIDQDDYDRLMGMQAKLQELRSCPELSFIFNRAERVEEALIFPLVDGIDAKMKPDLVGDDFILDYKTTQDAWIWGFQRTAKFSWYDLQMFFYQRGESMVSGKKKRLLILAQESEAPYEFQVYEVPQHFENDAWGMIDVAFSKYMNGKFGERKGYPREIISLDLTRGGM